MFKWRRSNNKMSYEPKTPKLTSVSLPDEQYVPKFDTRVPRPDAVSGRSRARTMSTPGGDVHAPRPIRPHPSQGGFLPVMESGDRTRRDHSRGPRVPVGGTSFLPPSTTSPQTSGPVPSAAFLEEQIRRSQQEIAPSSRSHTPTDKMHLSPVEFVDNSDPKRSRDATKRYGTKVSSHPSKAYLDDLNEQARRDHQPRHALVPSLKKTSSRSREPSDKELVDFDNWKAVPLDTDRYEPKHADRNAPLKPALKKSSADKPILKPILKSIMKKTDLMTDHKSKSYHSEAKGYHSESETRAKHEDRKPIRVAEVPSKAFLEEQKEKLEQIKQRGWASRQPPQARPELRAFLSSAQTTQMTRQSSGPAPFGHSSSSTTPSPTENILYDHHGRPLVRARRQSFTDHSTPISSSYMPAYIKQEGPMMTPRAIHHPMIDIPAGHGVLSWPLVEYSLRKRDPYPLVTFDAGFNPRDLRTPVKARRTYHSTALTREEMDIPVVYGMMVTEMIIVNKKLNLWPIHIKKHSNWNTLRVIDVFRAIYDTYSQPLTPQELRHFGEDYIRRCQPAFAQRCQDSPEFNHIEERRGLLRIDMLRGRRLFKGLVPVPGRPYHWELFFDDGR